MSPMPRSPSSPPPCLRWRRSSRFALSLSALPNMPPTPSTLSSLSEVPPRSQPRPRFQPSAKASSRSNMLPTPSTLSSESELPGAPPRSMISISSRALGTPPCSAGSIAWPPFGAETFGFMPSFLRNQAPMLRCTISSPPLSAGWSWTAPPSPTNAAVARLSAERCSCSMGCSWRPAVAGPSLWAGGRRSGVTARLESGRFPAIGLQELRLAVSVVGHERPDPGAGLDRRILAGVAAPPGLPRAGASVVERRMLLARAEHGLLDLLDVEVGLELEVGADVRGHLVPADVGDTADVDEHRALAQLGRVEGPHGHQRPGLSGRTARECWRCAARARTA